MSSHNLTLPGDIALDSAKVEKHVRANRLLKDGQYHQILKRSIDARKRQVKVHLQVEVRDTPIDTEYVEYQKKDHNVSDSDPVIIVGAGPAGLFAAIRAIENGLKPIILERGKGVRARRRDLAAINKDHIVNTESNYCFGEGGAGTYSDGKLYTRAKKRGSIRRIFEILVAHGAPNEILFEAHPHIGTNKLPKVVSTLRETIEAAGGAIRFDSKMTEILIENGTARGVKLSSGEDFTGVGVILATGHSARDIFRMCQQQNIKIEAKPFALGVRIEHPQQLIDKIQYHCDDRGLLPASSYSVVSQTNWKNVQRGVFSFCMCPGGFIVPAATEPGEIVVNGMSPSRRDSQFANSGMVVQVELEDIPEFHEHGDLAAMEFQASVEKKAWQLGGETQVAPAQRMVDFIQGKVSNQLAATSYQPGLKSVNMRKVLPEFIFRRLHDGFKEFGKKLNGYLTNDAQIVGVESRTSSPVRIPRDRETCEHVEIKGLFPCGEGAGFAGGIVSAAMDGERCMDGILKKLRAEPT